MGEVSRLFIAEARRHAMREMKEVEAIADRGFAGCIHGRPGSSRQVLLMDSETLDLLRVVPGDVRENITTAGLALNELRSGQQLQAGEAVLLGTKPCEPCERMDEIQPGLQEKICGRRGILCKVLQGGRVRRGDPIEILATDHEGTPKAEVEKGG